MPARARRQDGLLGHGRLGPGTEAAVRRCCLAVAPRALSWCSKIIESLLTVPTDEPGTRCNETG
jgi:hypothetical protein